MCRTPLTSVRRSLWTVLALVVALTTLGGPGRPAPVRAANTAPLALGTLTVADPPVIDPTCPRRYAGSCKKFTITNCPDGLGGMAPSIAGYYGTIQNTGTLRGLAVLIGGGGGFGWYGHNSSLNSPFLEGVSAGGLEIVTLRYEKPGWLGSVEGQRVGPDYLACRYATAVKWVHDNVYVPLGITAPGPGRCGFCITGNSGGATAVGYALSFYGLGSIIDGAFPTSGPGLTRIDYGCYPLSSPPGEWAYGGTSYMIDWSYGFLVNKPGGPCKQKDSTWIPEWQSASVDLGGFSYVYPTTRVHLIIGLADSGPGPAHAKAYYDALMAARANNPVVCPTASVCVVEVEYVEGMKHAIFYSQAGNDALKAALLA